MIYTCLTDHIKQYRLHGEVVQNKDEFITSIYRNNIDFFLVSVSFIEEHLTYDYFEKFLRSYFLSRQTKVVMFGRNAKIEIRNVYYIDIDEADFENVIKEARSRVQQHAGFSTKARTVRKFEEDLYEYVKQPYETADDEVVFTSYLLANANKIKDMLGEILSRHLNYSKDVTELQAVINTYQISRDEVAIDLANREKDLKNALDQIDILKAEYNNLVSMIYSKDGIKMPSLGPVNIPENKAVIYFKESSKVAYFDTFIRMYKRVLRNNGILSSIHIILPERAFKVASIYSNHYKNTNNITKMDLISSDTITVGYDRSILTTLLNYSECPNLLIVDKTQQDIDLVTGKYTRFGVMSDLEDNVYNVEKNNIISYDTSTLTIPSINKFNTVSEESRFASYARLPIMVEMLKRAGV